MTIQRNIGSSSLWPWRWCVWLGRCAPTTVLIRHADVTYVSGDSNPGLNGAGNDRRQALRHVLADAGIGAIFVTQFQRTQQTAEPLAADLGIVPVVIDDVDIDSFVAALRNLPASSVALVVGHTTNLSLISVRLGGPTIPQIGGAEFDHLFVQARGRLAHLRYGAA